MFRFLRLSLACAPLACLFGLTSRLYLMTGMLKVCRWLGTNTRTSVQLWELHRPCRSSLRKNALPYPAFMFSGRVSWSPPLCQPYTTLWKTSSLSCLWLVYSANSRCWCLCVQCTSNGTPTAAILLHGKILRWNFQNSAQKSLRLYFLGCSLHPLVRCLGAWVWSSYILIFPFLARSPFRPRKVVLSITIPQKMNEKVREEWRSHSKFPMKLLTCYDSSRNFLVFPFSASAKRRFLYVRGKIRAIRRRRRLFYARMSLERVVQVSLGELE